MTTKKELVDTQESITPEISQKHGVPALLSFFLPGLGQLVKGDILKAITFFIGMITAGVLTIVLIGFILLPIVFLWNVYDAYNAN